MADCQKALAMLEAKVVIQPLRPRRDWHRRYLLLAPVLVVGLYGCQPQAPASGGRPAPDIVPPGRSLALNADEFQIVDCLLPARIRRLGRSLTYLGSRRPVRTTGRDCAIRGGEYVLYDRANYETALEIWRPLAEQGDPEAQTYVGDIYERGLVGQPDYVMAAEWYQRAAEQGYSTAQISLGELYERGSEGFPKNVELAQDLYHRASDLNDTFIPVPAVASKSAVAPITNETEQSIRESEELTKRGEKLSEQLGEAKAKIATAQAEIATLENEAGTQQRADQAGIEDIHAALRERDAELAKREEQLESRTANISAREATLKRSEHQAEAALEALQKARLDYLKQQRELDFESQQIAGEREWLNQQEATARQTLEERADLEGLRAELREREGRLSQRAEEINIVAAEISNDEAELERMRHELETEQGSLEKAHQEYASRQEELDLEQQRISVERETLSEQLASVRQAVEQEAEIEGLRARLHSAESEHVADLNRALREAEAKQSKGMERLQAALQDRTMLVVLVDQQSKEIARYQNEIAGHQAEISDLEEQMLALSRELAQQLQQSLDQLASLDYGEYYALVIGNNGYHKMEKLKTATVDANAISSILQQKYGYDVVTRINATREQILRALNSFEKKLTHKDNLLIYYAGHGKFDERNNRGHWLPVDADPDQNLNWISTDDITDRLNSMRAKHVLVIADSCYAGALSESGIPQMAIGVEKEERVSWLRTMIHKPARLVLTSGGLRPVPDGGGGQHSMFARVLIEELGTNTDVMEGWRLFLRLAGRVSDAAEMYGIRQTPTYRPIELESHEGGDYLFVPAA